MSDHPAGWTTTELAAINGAITPGVEAPEITRIVGVGPKGQPLFAAVDIVPGSFWHARLVCRNASPNCTQYVCNHADCGNGPEQVEARVRDTGDTHDEWRRLNAE